MFEKLKKYLSGTSKGATGADANRLAFRRIVASVIFGAIILVFVLFGFQGKHTAMGNGAAARVNSAYISDSDLRLESEHMERMYAQMFGGQMNGEAQRQFVRGQALETLIQGELISQSARNQGILVTNAEVRDFILNKMPDFKQDGIFRKERYVQILEANHLTPSEFEEQIRKDRWNFRLHHVFEAASEPLALEEDKLKALKNNKIDIAFVKMDDAQAANSVTVSEADIKAKLADAGFAKRVEDDFNLNKGSYSSEEQVRASHILIKAKTGDAKSQAEALAKIQTLQKRAEKEDFAKLAAANTEDFGTKQTKGDLGFFGHGKMVPEFDQAAFSQPVGKVGAPVKTNYGYHLIKVTEKKAAVVATLDNMRNKIAKKLIAQEKFAQATKGLEEALPKADEKAVDAAIAGLGFKWDETGYFDLGADMAPKIGSKLATQASFEVSSAKPLLPRLVRDGAATYVLKFKGAKTEASPAEKSADLNITRERSSEMFSRWLDNVKKTATIEKNPLVMRE